jgi:hypothetical protein
MADAAADGSDNLLGFEGASKEAARILASFHMSVVTPYGTDKVVVFDGPLSIPELSTVVT